MENLIRISSFIILIFSGIMSQAQTQPSMQDPSAEIYLEKIAGEYSGITPIQIEFKYEIYSGREDARISDYGSLIIKDSNYKLKTEDTEVFFNGEKMWTFLRANEEVYLSTPEPGSVDPMMSNPFSLLSNFREYYKYQNKGEVEYRGKKLTEIDLYPKELNTHYSILRLRIGKDGLLHSLTMKQKDGIDITVIINELIRNITVSDATFEWDESKHPDVLVIEM